MSSVKVHDYIRPASSNGTSTAQSIPNSYQSSFWERIKRILPHREDLVLADGRQLKGGIVIHPIIATALLGVVITIGLSVRSEMSWQHDQLITISTQKIEAEKYAAKQAEDLQKRLQNMDAVQIVLGRDIAKLQEAAKAKDTRQ